jgi:hypothetical protein
MKRIPSAFVFSNGGIDIVFAVSMFPHITGQEMSNNYSRYVNFTVLAEKKLNVLKKHDSKFMRLRVLYYFGSE